MKAIKTFFSLEGAVDWCNEKGINFLHTQIVPIVVNGNTDEFKLVVDKRYVDKGYAGNGDL